MAYDYQLPDEDDILHTAQLRAGYPISRRDFDALMNAGYGDLRYEWRHGRMYLAKEIRKHNMQLRKMDHTALIVQDVEQSRKFYGEVLGLQEVPRPSTFNFGGAWFQGSDFQIHLILAKDTTAPAGFAEAGEAVHTGRAHHIAFEVDDVAQAIAHLRSHNVEIVGGPQQRGDGVTQFYVYDPDRNFLEFFAWDK